MGVQLINLGKRDAVVGIARNAEAGREAEEVDGDVIVDESAEVETAVETDEGTEPATGSARSKHRERSHGRRIDRYGIGRRPWPRH